MKTPVTARTSAVQEDSVAGVIHEFLTSQGWQLFLEECRSEIDREIAKMRKSFSGSGVYAEQSRYHAGFADGIEFAARQVPERLMAIAEVERADSVAKSREVEPEQDDGF